MLGLGLVAKHRENLMHNGGVQGYIGLYVPEFGGLSLYLGYWSSFQGVRKVGLKVYGCSFQAFGISGLGGGFRSAKTRGS